MAEERENIQFLIVGMSHDHIFKIINHFHPLKVFLISSSEMEESVENLNDQLKNLNMNTHIIYINAFNGDSIQQTASRIVHRAKKELIELLNECGPLRIDEISKEVGRSESYVRRLLNQMDENIKVDLLTGEEQGRPAKLYSLK